jgi:hypothetical protein
MTKPIAWILAGAACLWSGCTASMGDVAMLSTQPALASGVVLRRDAVAQNCAHDVLGIPLGQRMPNLAAAVAAAVGEGSGGMLLTNVSVENDYFISGLYNLNCIRVQGDVVGK